MDDTARVKAVIRRLSGYAGWYPSDDHVQEVIAAARPTADLGDDGELERVSQAIIAEIRRQTNGDWPREMEKGLWLVDDTLDIAALARAVLSRSGG